MGALFFFEKTGERRVVLFGVTVMETQGDLMAIIKVIESLLYAPVQGRNWTKEVNILWLEISNCLPFVQK